MRRIVIGILCFVILALGTGALTALHNAQHAREDAADAQGAKYAGRPIDQHPVHDDSNCAVHAQLHAPFVSGGWVPLLVYLGLFVAFLTEIPPALVSHRFRLSLQSCGPPALA